MRDSKRHKKIEGGDYSDKTTAMRANPVDRKASSNYFNQRKSRMTSRANYYAATK